jgi:hypothetical protein
MTADVLKPGLSTRPDIDRARRKHRYDALMSSFPWMPALAI